MKKTPPLYLLLTVLILFTVFSKAQNQKQPSSLGFTENKGQVSDQHGNSRPDVLFSCNTGNLLYHLRSGGISYQLSKVESWKTEKDEFAVKTGFDKLKPDPDRISIYRLDLEWLNSSASSKILTDQELAGFSNYYGAVCPNGVHGVKTYNGLTYKNIYNNIDLHYYLNGSELKYDYLVAPFADYTQIKIKIKGATRISLGKDGSVILESPLGEIKEAAPLVYQDKKQVPAKWILENDELSFYIKKYDPSQPLLIDPLVRTWGTYYGSSGLDDGRACTTDASSNVFLAGRTGSGATIATTGAFNTTLTGTYDAYLVKFNSAGVRQWATYYGGSGDDYGNACVADASGNIYLAGQTSPLSTSGITSPATGHQGFHGGGSWDGFLVKFNSSGVRQWGTYYGSTGYDIIEGLTMDPTSSYIYMSGFSDSPYPAFPNVVTAGAHQTTAGSGLLVKFSTGGVRQWATFYGDSPYTHGTSCATDASGNVFMAGNTIAANGIATAGAHQTAQIGLQDGYLVKFNSAGVRQWGTYYGEISLESINSCVVDASGNVYIAGSTGSPANMATPGAYQTVIGTVYNPDGLLVKFDGAGVRQWGTYYGGTTEDAITSCILVPNGDIFIAGITNSSLNISAPNGFQTIYGGSPTDGFLARFTPAGARLWASYYGGSAEDVISAATSDPNGAVYVAGKTGSSSGTVIATVASHQAVYGGGASDAFLARFYECITPASPVNATTLSSQTLCAGSSATVSATGPGTVNWYTTATSVSSLGSGTVFISPALSAGTATFFAEVTSTCLANSARTPITVTVVPVPATTIIASSSAVCAGESATLTAFGATSYSWNTGSSSAAIVVAPTAQVSYTVKGISNGCSFSASTSIAFHALPSLTLTSDRALICKGESALLTASGAFQYSWNTSATGSTLNVSPLAQVYYTVTGTSAEGCKSSASINLLVSNCTGIQKTKATAAINVFPNPFTDLIHIETVSSAELKIVNALGQSIRQQRINEGESAIDLTSYAKGIYFLELKTPQESRIFRVVKE